MDFRRYNEIALAVFLTCALILMGVVSFYSLREKHADEGDAFYSPPATPGVGGEEFETANGIVTAYKKESADDPQAVFDVRYVAMASGKIVALASDPEALVYGERAVGDLGRVALVKTGSRNEVPVFDLVFVGFPNLDRHVVATSIEALDTVQQLDASSFSAIIWDTRLKGRFAVVDAQSGAIRNTRALDFSRPQVNSDDMARSQAADAAAADTLAALKSVEAEP